MTRRTRYLVITVLALAALALSCWGLSALAAGMRARHGGG
jgi:hypothetical protein